MVLPCLSEGWRRRSLRGLESVATNRASLNPATRSRGAPAVTRAPPRARGSNLSRRSICDRVGANAAPTAPAPRDAGGQCGASPTPQWGCYRPPRPQMSVHGVHGRLFVLLQVRTLGTVKRRRSSLRPRARPQDPPTRDRPNLSTLSSVEPRTLGGYRARWCAHSPQCKRANRDLRSGAGPLRCYTRVPAPNSGRPSAHMPTPALYSYGYSYARA